MTIKPARWTHYHTMRLYHIARLAIFLFIMAAIAPGIFIAAYGQALAETQSLQPTVNATVPAIYGQPAVIQPAAASVAVGGADNQYALKTPAPAFVNPPFTSTKVYSVTAKLVGSNVSSKTMVINGKKVEVWQLDSAYPEFEGMTNVPQAAIFIDIHSNLEIHGATYADSSGAWSWKSAEPIDAGFHTATVEAHNGDDFSLLASTTFQFYMDVATGSTPPALRVSALAHSGPGVLFDVLVKILDQFKVISPGDQVAASIKLVNFGSPGRPVDVPVQYTIEDSKGGVVYQSSETVAVATQISLLKVFTTNSVLTPGTYDLVVKVPSQNLIASSDDTFQIKGQPNIILSSVGKIDYTVMFQALLALMFMFSLVAYFEYNKVSILSYIIKKVGEDDLRLYNQNKI